MSASGPTSGAPSPVAERRAELAVTAAAAVATAAAALAMWPIFTGQAWLRSALLAVGCAAVVGATGRRVGAPRVLVLLAQLAALVLLVTALFLPDNAAFGLVPTSGSWAELGDLAREGARSINEQTIPVLDVPGIVLLVTIGIGVAAIEVDFIAVALRNPAVAGFVLLAVYLVPVVVLPDGAGWGWFVVAAAGWLVLLYVAQRAAVRRWGEVVEPDASSVTADSPRTRLAARIAVVAVGGAVLLAGALPGLGEGVVDGVGQSGGADSDDSGSTAVRLDLSATLERSLRSDENVPLLAYRTDDGSAQYLRLTVLDNFDGLAWQPARLPLRAPEVSTGIQPLAGVSSGSGELTDLVTTVSALGTVRDLGYLPTPYTAIQVADVSDAWQWDQRTATVFSRSERLDDLTFTVLSRSLDPRPEVLAAAGSTLAEQSDKVVPDVPDLLRSTAVDAVAGATSGYEQAVRLQAYFRNNFAYDLDAPVTDDASALEQFLTDKRGYCQQFAATYALMARVLGMPSRVVVGFAPGTVDGEGVYTVRSHDFHAWPEVWFDGAGWVRFEPTPSGQVDSSIDVPAWSVQGGGPAAEPTPTPTSTSAPTASQAPRPTNVPLGDGTVAAEPAWRDAVRAVGLLGVLVLVLFLAAGPGLARALRRRRRLSGPRGAAAVEAAWSELGDTAVDLGLDWPEADTPRRTADALVASAALDGPAAGAVQDLRRDLERVRYAPRARVQRPPAPAVREVREVLMAQTPRGRRWQSRWFPASMVRRKR